MSLRIRKRWSVVACCAGFVFTVGAANSPPTIGPIPDQTVVEDQPTHAYQLALDDLETPVPNLQLSRASSDTTLVPAENIFFGGAAGHWYVTVTPAFGRTGSATITVTVSDGTDSASTNFVLTVDPPPPGAARFANPSPMTIPDVGAATPYPLTNSVTGMSGTITNMTVTLSKFSHHRVQDVNMLLVSPSGQGVVIFSHVSGGNRSATNVTVHLTDASAYYLPQDFQLWSEPLKPAAFPPGVTFPAPAPPGPYGPVALSTFNGVPANGTWSLYVTDDTSPTNGRITGGWSLMIATTGGNLAPTISDIPDQSTPVNTPTAAIQFTIADADTPVGSLTLSTNSSNKTLVPLSNIVTGGSGTNRTVTVTPAAGQMGTTTITITVSDGINNASDSFVLAVGVTNTPPTITGIPNQTIDEDTSSGALAFTVGDAETTPGSLTLSKGSSNPTLVPTNNLVFGGSGSNRTVIVTPATGQTGTSTITIAVSDGTNSANTSFLLIVSPPFKTTVFANTNAVMIPDVGDATPYPSTINVQGIAGTITNLTVTLNGVSHTWPADVDMLLVGPGGQKIVIVSDAGIGNPITNVTITMSDAALDVLPLESPIVTGTYLPTDYEPGEQGELDSFPAPAPSGPYTTTHLSVFNGLSPNGAWSLYVVDDGPGDQGSISGGWSLALSTVSPPAISDIADQSRIVNTGIPAIPFTMNDAETAASNLVLSVGSSNPTLLPTNDIAFGGSGTNRTLTLTPLTNQLGTATITVTVTDGDGMIASDSFVLTIKPPGPVTMTSVAPLAGNNFRITGAGDTNVTYTIQASTNLLQWQNIGAATAGGNGLFQFDDLNATNSFLRFYRTALR